MRTVYFLFVQEITRILAQLSIWFFEHCGEISCSLLVNPSHNDASQEGRNTCLWVYALNLFTEHSGEHWWEQNIFCSFTTPQAFWQSSAPGALSTLVTSVVLCSLTRATMMSPGKDKTRVCGYIYIYYIDIYIICSYVWLEDLVSLHRLKFCLEFDWDLIVFFCGRLPKL